MKKFNVFLIAALMLVVSIGTAQVVYTDDFESYTTGQGLAAQETSGIWTTWSNTPGGAEDAVISEDAAYQGIKSMVIQNTNDAVLQLNDLTSGRYRVEFYLMIPSGFQGYYNILQNFNGQNSTWGMQVFLKNGSARIDGNGQNATQFNYTPGEWMKIQHFVDLDNDWIDFYVNGELVHAYQWSHGTFNDGNGINKLDAFNFFAWNEEGTPKFYMDNYIIEQVESPEAAQNLTATVVNSVDVELTWQAPAQGTPLSYSVIRDGEEIASVTELTYTDVNLYPKTYEYQVKAYYGEAVGYAASPSIEEVEIEGGNPRSLVLFEDFTGTWCPYCPNAAKALDMIEEEGLNVAIIEYHAGDNYETPATNIRANVYSVEGYPTVIIDGKTIASSGDIQVLKDFYTYWHNEYMAKPTVYKITPTVTSVSSNVFDISVDVEETLDYYNNDEMRLFVALTETHIPENWQGGMTEVNFVLRKMLPNGNGTVLNFSSGSVQNHTFQLNLNSSYVKSNCEMVFFVQNMNTKEIMETVKVSGETFVNVENDETMALSVYPNPAKNSVNITASETIEEVTFISITGQVVKHITPQEKQIRISTADLTQGVYTIKINSKTKTSTKQLIVQ